MKLTEERILIVIENFPRALSIVDNQTLKICATAAFLDIETLQYVKDHKIKFCLSNLLKEKKESYTKEQLFLDLEQMLLDLDETIKKII